MTCEDKLKLLNEGDFFALFSTLGAQPFHSHSNGRRSFNLLGLCHGGSGASVLFDPATRVITCLSACGQSYSLVSWIKKVLQLSSQLEALDVLENWIDGQDIDLSTRVPTESDIGYTISAYKPKIVEPVPGIDSETISELYKGFDSSLETLSRLVWSTQEGITPETLRLLDVAYCPERGSIILPHHNIRGEVVGLYERTFKPLQRELVAMFPDVEPQAFSKAPAAKYRPMVKESKYLVEGGKPTWSFSNSQNLYGLHLAKDSIKAKGVAIVFEGAKSVMLARQMGYEYCVATHSFAINDNHMSMLIEAGAKEIILAFDRQYKYVGDKEWALFDQKTRNAARKADRYVNISRIADRLARLGYKDAPVDKGKEIFDTIFKDRENLSEKASRSAFVERLAATVTQEEKERKILYREESLAYLAKYERIAIYCDATEGV